MTCSSEWQNRSQYNENFRIVYSPLERYCLCQNVCYTVGETRTNPEGHMVLWCNGLALKNHFKMFFLDFKKCNIHDVQYRSNVSRQSRLETRSSILVAFENRELSFEARVSSFETLSRRIFRESDSHLEFAL